MMLHFIRMLSENFCPFAEILSALLNNSTYLAFIADREDDSQQPTDASANNRKPAAGEGYTPPTNLYAFPPNIDAAYPPPGGPQKPISVSSYLPPASGPTNYPIYAGPLAPRPEPPLSPQRDNMQQNSPPDMDGNDSGNDNGMNDGGPSQPSDDLKQIADKPPSNFMPEIKPDVPSLPFLDHEHDQGDDHDHHSDDHPPFPPYSDDSLKHLHGFDAYPGILILWIWFFFNQTVLFNQRTSAHNTNCEEKHRK